nr:hypothetical protein B0A51_02802 [Rachicladosporium sp. CCFEE 5018]
MPPTPDDPLQSPQDSDSESNISVPKRRESLRKSPLASITSLPYRRSNASLSTLFQSTTSLPGTHVGSPSESTSGTPTGGVANGSVFSPGAVTARREVSPAGRRASLGVGTSDTILRAFAPHVSVLASQDTEELVRHKGVTGGLLELLRPYGEHVQGKVTIRDSSGASRSWDDFGIRFTGVRDGLEAPRPAERRSTEGEAGLGLSGTKRLSTLEFKPARLRSGGDVPQIEDLVDRHLTFAEEQSSPFEEDYLTSQTRGSKPSSQAESPFYKLYFRRLLSGLPMVPFETFSHPVATVIAISSRSPSPIEELRSLYASSNTGESRVPPWVLNEFLRYYVLVHDEDYDDITKSMALYDQMKRHFGLHCHLLRLRSTQCVPTDDDSTKLPRCEWMAAAEELTEIVRRETSEDDEDATPCIFESDANAIHAFVREMVTQSIIPSMERASAQWNDQVASRRRGISGRFMSLSKRFTTFGTRSATGPSLGGVSSNYDALQGIYKPDAPEAIMRRLADYAIMLRDFKLAQSTYEILCQDFKNDKAWRHYAASNEMAAVSMLLAASGSSSKARVEGVDQYLETAYYSYITRVGSPYNALRTVALGVELLRLRGGTALEDCARWLSRAIDDRLVGPVGHVLELEAIASCFTERKAEPTSTLGGRRRKAAFWYTLAADAWLRLEKTSQAEQCLAEALKYYTATESAKQWEGMHGFLVSLQATVRSNRAGPQPLDLQRDDDEQTLVEPLQGEIEPVTMQFPTSPMHRKSISVAKVPELNAVFDPLGVGSGELETSPAVMRSPHGAGVEITAPSPVLERRRTRDDGFE